jgi:flagellar L-ring protein FlgH
MRTVLVSLFIASWAMTPASGQTSSIGRRFAGESAQRAKSDLRREGTKGNPVLERFSLTAVKPKQPRKFQLHDVIVVIVREQRDFEVQSDFEVQKRFLMKSQVNAFFELLDDRLAAAKFQAGKPNIDYKYQTRLTNEADKEREDNFTMRVAAEVVDIKPNGNLVLEARGEVAFDDEVSAMSLTGTARAADITADNSVLSTQLANKRIRVHNTGAARDGSRRGWLTKLLDAIRPF